MNDEFDPDDPESVNELWQRLWDSRLDALEATLGTADDSVFETPIPFYLGGGASVLTFRQHNAGVAYVTADIIGDDQAEPNEMGQYELMLCLRREAKWAPQLLCELAQYTREAVLAPRDTMDLEAALPQPTQLAAFVFVPYATIEVLDAPAGLLLCLGITADELELCHAGENGYDDLLARLKAADVYPFTDLKRKSVLA